jgi:NTE family protein
VALDERLDLFAIKHRFERYADLISLGGVVADLSFLRRARRALLPLPLIDRQPEVDTSAIFPPFRPRSVPPLEGKRIALVASGGGGAAVALVGVARALEEAGVEPAEIVGCSGGAIWGSMWAAGLSAQEMAEFSLRWTPEDYLDVQWLKVPRFALSALRGFTGLAKGEAIERLFDERVAGMRCGETAIPIKTIVYNMDLVSLADQTRPVAAVKEEVRCSVDTPSELIPPADRVRDARARDGNPAGAGGSPQKARRDDPASQ